MSSTPFKNRVLKFCLSSVLAVALTGCRSKQWDITDLKIATVVPRCEDGYIPANAVISVTFTKPIKRASGKITVIGSNGNSVVDGTITGDDLTLTFTPRANLSFDQDYTVIVPDSIEDVSGNKINGEYRHTCHTESGVDTIPPVTTPSLAPGVYNSAQSTTLQCTDNLSGCQKIVYTTDGSAPTLVNGTVVNGASTGSIPLGFGENKIRYAAIDNAGNIAPYYEALYSISSAGYLMVATDIQFARGIGATPSHFETMHSGLHQYRVFRDPVTNLIYVAAHDGLFISNTNGATYTWRSIDLPGDSVVGPLLNAFSVYADRRTIVVATLIGLAISTDGGNTFTHKILSASDSMIGDVYVKGNLIYAAGAMGTGFYISNDLGNTFVNRTTANGLGSDGIVRIFVDGSKLYVVTSGGLSISTDGGASFVNRTTANGIGSLSISDVFASGNNVVVATDAGLSISTDGGTTFQNRTAAQGLPSSWPIAVGGYGNRIYASFHNTLTSPASSHGVSASTDGGLTFQTTALPVPHRGSIIRGLFADASGLYGASTLGLLKSANGGQTLTQDTAHLPFSQVEGGVAVSGNHLYVGANNLAYSANGGTDFITLNQSHGLDYSVLGLVQDIEIAGGNIYVATLNGLAVAPVGVHAFTRKTTGNGLSGNYIEKLYADGAVLYAVSGTKINRTSDGNTFTVINTPVSTPIRNLWVSGNEILLAVQHEGMYRSSNGGANWVQLDDQNGWIFDSAYYSTNYIPNAIFKEGNTIYFATDTYGLFVSQDNGATFNPMTGYDIFFNNIIQIVKRDNILYLGVYDSNPPSFGTPYENVLNWSANRVIYGTSPNQENELGGAIYGIERYLNPNGDG